MPTKDDSWRWRDVFPTTYAAWLSVRGGSRRSAKFVSQSIEVPSAWTTAVLAGGLALCLSIVLLLVDPPPDASLSSGQTLGLMSAGTDAAFPPPLELAIVHGGLPLAWDERLEELWASQPSGDEFNPAFPLAFDNWSAAQSPSLTVAATAPQEFEPYYLKADFIEFDQLTAAVSAAESPAPGASAVALHDLAVFVERGPATPTEGGAVAYTLRVRNSGREPAGHVRVIETLPEVERVIDVVPPAAITPDGALVWELSELAPFEERVLTITLMPGEQTTLETVAAVDVESQFSVVTIVHPAQTVEPFRPTFDPIDLALPAFDEPAVEPAPALFDEPIVDAPVEESPVAMPADPPEEEPVNAFDPFDSAPAAADEPPVMPSWLLEENEAPPAIADERPVPDFPAFDEPVVEEPAPEPDWDPTPRPVPLDPVQPPRPLLSLKARSQATAATGDVVTTVFEIVNDGDAPAEGVLLTVHLDPALKHKHGATVEHHIDQLAPGESRTATLYTRAAREGIAKFDAVLSHAGQDDDAHEYAVRITLPKTGTGRTPPRR